MQKYLIKWRSIIVSVIRRVIGTQYVIDSLRSDIQSLARITAVQDTLISTSPIKGLSSMNASPMPSDIIGDGPLKRLNFEQPMDHVEDEVTYHILWLHEKKRVESLTKEIRLLRRLLQIKEDGSLAETH